MCFILLFTSILSDCMSNNIHSVLVQEGVHCVWHHTVSLMHWLLHSLNWHTVDSVKQMIVKYEYFKKTKHYSSIINDAMIVGTTSPSPPPPPLLTAKCWRGRYCLTISSCMLASALPAPQPWKHNSVNKDRIILHVCQCLCKRKICWSNPQAW